jgi:hypothetical protein
VVDIKPGHFCATLQQHQGNFATNPITGTCDNEYFS